jgi:hypothetical protein
LEPVRRFAYGLSLTVPRINRQVVPPAAGVELGRRLPALANVMCCIYRVAG